MFLLIWTVALSVAVIFYFRRVYTRFSRYGVKNLWVVPPFGNMMKVFLRMEHMVYGLDHVYYNFPNERFTGRFELMKPVVLIQDLNLIKQIILKDFECFHDHTGVAADKMFSRNLFSLRGDEWKAMRSTLSPAFTSSKIRLMVPFMEEVGTEMINTLKKDLKESNDQYIEMDCKDLTTRFANDVIATCAFGLKVNSLVEPCNKFYVMGKTAATFKYKQILAFFVNTAMPTLGKLLNLRMINEETEDFFLSLVLDTMKDREAKNVVRQDMIHLLMAAKKGQLVYDEKESGNETKDTGFATVEESAIGKKKINKVWSDFDLVAQAVIFFIAGFEGISAVMSLALYELALNPDVQERLAQEIRENDKEHGGKLDYNSILEMTYMDMFVSVSDSESKAESSVLVTVSEKPGSVFTELLRLWPAGMVMERQCTKDYNLGRPNSQADQDYIVRAGEVVNVPVWSIHHDPRYFPHPEKFDPERFSEKNKHSINPLTYMPFGLGPRNCIGSRFALCEIKVLLYQVLRHLVVSPSPRTRSPARLSADSFNVRLEGGHWLRFALRPQ